MIAALPDPTGSTGAVLGWITGHILSAGPNLAMAPINALASGLADAVGDMLATLGTIWLKVDVPDVWSGGTTSGTVEFLHSQVAPLVGLLAVFGIIIGACRLAWEQRLQPGRDLIQGLLVLVLVTGCGVPVIGLLTSGADAWAQSIIENATGGTDFGHSITGMLKLTGPALAPVLLIFFAIVALLVSVVMVGLLVFRAAMLVMLAGLLPVAASMTTTQTGREHFKKYCAWVIALTAWKPCAALIYAAAFRLVGTHELGATGAGSVLIGLTLMIAAIVALPALLRFLVPAVGALSIGTGGSGGALMAASMALPTGARMLASAGAGAGGVIAGSSSAGPSGATPSPGASSSNGSSGPPGAPGSTGSPGQSGTAGASAPYGGQSAAIPAADSTGTIGGPHGSQHD